MKVVVGIGNPGRRYEGTRHNLGFRVVDRLAGRHGIVVSRRRFDALSGDGLVGAQRALLVKPQTYVNLSGSAVAPHVRWHKCPLDHLLVVCDDLNLDLGRLRTRRKGSSGGHNGLASIIECLGTDAFARIRVGIGRGRGHDPVAHVLSRFDRDEEPVIESVVDRAVDAVEAWLAGGTDAVMNAFN